MLDTSLSGSVWEGLFDPTIRVLSDSGSIGVKYVFLAIGVLNGLDAVLFDPLDCTIREYALFFTIGKDALDRSVWEAVQSKVRRYEKLLT